jgi:hypothetical protein
LTPLEALFGFEQLGVQGADNARFSHAACLVLVLMLGVDARAGAQSTEHQVAYLQSPPSPVIAAPPRHALPLASSVLLIQRQADWHRLVMRLAHGLTSITVGRALVPDCKLRIPCRTSLKGAFRLALSHNFQPQPSHLNRSSGLALDAVLPQRGHFIVQI